MVQSLDLELAAGEILQLAGPNGSGKTTLLRALCGLLDCNFDQMIWNETAVESPLEFADELIFLGHRAAVRDRLTVSENLRWLASLNPHSRTDGLAELLAQVRLRGYEDELAASLSAGQKRRLTLSRLQFAPARLWVLDEPFASLDSQGVEMLRGWISDFVNSGGSVLYSTHQQVDFPGCRVRKIDMAWGQRPAHV